MIREHHVGCLIVMAGGNETMPVGVLTDRDIVIEVLAEEVSLESVIVRDIMTPTPVFAMEDDDILTVLFPDGRTGNTPYFGHRCE